MSSELRAAALPSVTVYALIYNNLARVYKPSAAAFEDYVSASYANYAVSTDEQGGSGIYVGDFPVAITSAGTYDIFYYLAESGSPVEGDRIVATGEVTWDGTAVTVTTPTVAGQMSGSDWIDYVVRAFKRSDKNTEILDATTDAIQEIRRRLTLGDDETEVTITDSITVLGQYQMDLETDHGTLIDVFLQDSTLGIQLDLITKAEYDRRYGIYGQANLVRAVPESACVFGNKILVGPVPDRVDYVYKITYAADNHINVTAATTSVPYTKQYREPLKMGVLARVYNDVQNDDQATKYGSLWDSFLKQIEVKEDRGRKAQTFQVRYQGV